MKEFLDKYDTVIFDLDGVITSEQCYWDAAALTVWEYLYSDTYIGNEKLDITPFNDTYKQIRAKVFCDDKVIYALKGKGVNSNWDLAYITILVSMLNDEYDFDKVLEYAENMSDNVLDEYEILAKHTAEKCGGQLEDYLRNGIIWKTIQNCFQEWFLGDKIYGELYGKEPLASGKIGLVHYEQPVIEIEKVRAVINELSKTKRLCTATGRIFSEMDNPLSEWGIKKYFSPDGLCNYDHVTVAEKKLKLTLTKPHPYMFLKALYGTDYDDEKILNVDYDKSKIEKVLVVGDAGADILAAKAMGADFCAVLTGVSGQAARGYFEGLNAEYILNSIADFE